jgi:hypothetical protein
MKIIELFLEISNSVPKPLQRIRGHLIDELGFRLWSHHYPRLPAIDEVDFQSNSFEKSL